MAESAAIEDIRDEDGLLQPEFVAKVRACITAGMCNLDPLIAGDERYIRDDLPIVNVTWSEAQEFCRWRLTAKEAQAGLTLDEFHARLQSLMVDPNIVAAQKDLLMKLAVYADKLEQGV